MDDNAIEFKKIYESYLNWKKIIFLYILIELLIDKISKK